MTRTDGRTVRTDGRTDGRSITAYAGRKTLRVKVFFRIMFLTFRRLYVNMTSPYTVMTPPYILPDDTADIAVYKFDNVILIIK